MKKILSTFLILLLYTVQSQNKIDGFLSANKFSQQIISQYDGTYFWLIHNSKYTIVDTKGTVIMKDIGMKNVFQPANNIAEIHNGIFVDYNKEKRRSRFVSLQHKKPLTDYVYSEIIPYNNGTYLAVKDIVGKKEYHYLDQDLKILYKAKLNLKTKNSGRFASFRAQNYSKDKLIQIFGAFNEELVKSYDHKKLKYGFVNKYGRLTIPKKFAWVADFSEGLSSFQNDEKLFGFINSKGIVVIPAKFSKKPYSFSSGRAKVVSKKGFLGFIDTKGQVAVNPKYKYATNFYKNRALVKETRISPILLINEKGEVLKEFDKNFKTHFQERADAFMNPAIFDEYLTHINQTLKQLVDFKKAIFHKNINAYGLVDIEGNIILDFKYSSLKDYNNGLMLAIVKQGNSRKEGLMNEKGEFIVEAGESEF